MLTSWSFLILKLTGSETKDGPKPSQADLLSFHLSNDFKCTNN